MQQRNLGEENLSTNRRGARLLLLAAAMFTVTGCTSFQYATDPVELRAPGYPLSYPAYEVVIAREGDLASADGHVNCYDDAGCLERLVAYVRRSPTLEDQLFMIPPDGSTLSIEHGPSGHGVRAVGWDTNAPPSSGAGTPGNPQQWPLRSIVDPTAPSLRFRIRVPIVLDLPAGSPKHDDATVERHDVGKGNPGLSFSTTFSARAKGVIKITEFIKRVRRQGDSVLLFPTPACRTATITLSATDTNDVHKDVAVVSLPVPDVHHVVPVPIRRGSYIRLDPVCGVQALY